MKKEAGLNLKHPVFGSPDWIKLWFAERVLQSNHQIEANRLIKTAVDIFIVKFGFSKRKQLYFAVK